VGELVARWWKNAACVAVPRVQPNLSLQLTCCGVGWHAISGLQRSSPASVCG